MVDEKKTNMMESVQKTAQGEIPKHLKKQIDGYRTILSKLIHSKETRKGTLQMLQSGPPEISIPRAALTINRKAEDLMNKKGLKMTNEVKLSGAIFLVSDLVEVGNAAAKWENPVDEQETQMIFQDTLQDYIQQGLKEGTIDPIELQQETEPLLNDEQRKIGSEIAQKEGVPMEPTQQQILGNQQGVLKNSRGGM